LVSAAASSLQAEVLFHPFGLSLSKPSLYRDAGEGQGFDKLSPNGINRP
jgi:hypothetical protein